MVRRQRNRLVNGNIFCTIIRMAENMINQSTGRTNRELSNILFNVQRFFITVSTFLNRRIKRNTTCANKAMFIVRVRRGTMVDAFLCYIIWPSTPRLITSLCGAGLGALGTPFFMNERRLIRLHGRDSLVSVCPCSSAFNNNMVARNFRIRIFNFKGSYNVATRGRFQAVPSNVRVGMLGSSFHYGVGSFRNVFLDRAAARRFTQASVEGITFRNAELI